MDKKKLITFALCAIIPTAGIGLTIHHTNAIIGSLLTSVVMFIPMLAVILTQVFFKEPLLRGLDMSFKINRWWIIGWLFIPVIIFATLGMTLLMPGARWSPDSELMQLTLSSLPEGIGVWGVIAISTISGLFAGISINAVFAFGEEIAWRGYLMKLFSGKSFLMTALWTGTIWGFWHAPIILNGHNYPQHPVAGVFMMVIFCLLLTPILMYFRKKSSSVIVPAIMHGTLNGIAGLNLILITPANDLLYGSPGLAGLIVLLIADFLLFLYDRFFSQERIMTSATNEMIRSTEKSI